MAFDYRTTIHTIEIKVSSDLDYPAFMECCNSLDGISEIHRSGAGLYTMRFNPHKFNGTDEKGLYHLRYMPLSEHKQILNRLQEEIQASNLTISRLDLCCDPQIDYSPSEKILRFLILIMAYQIEAYNRYMSIDPLTMEIKTIRIESRKGYNGKAYNSELQIEHYNRALIDQTNWKYAVINRLELRSSGTEAGENYGIEEIVDRWKSRLKTVTEPVEMSKKMQAVEYTMNQALIEQWRQLAYQMDTQTGKSFNDFVFYNLNHIFTRRQMIELFRLYGDNEQQALNRAKNIRRDRRKAFNGRMFTKMQLSEEFESIIQSIGSFIHK